MIPCPCAGQHYDWSSTLSSPSGLHCLIVLSDRCYCSHEHSFRGGTLLRVQPTKHTHTPVTVLTSFLYVFWPDGRCLARKHAVSSGHVASLQVCRCLAQEVSHVNQMWLYITLSSLVSCKYHSTINVFCWISCECER